MSSGSLECLYWLRNPRCSVRCRHLRILVAVICCLYADDSGSNESMPTYTMHLCISCGIIILFVGFAHQTLEYSKSSKFATHQNIPWKVFELCAREEQGLNRYLEDVLVIQLSNNSDGDLKIMMRICEDDHDEVDFAMPEWSSSRDSPWTSSWSWEESLLLALPSFHWHLQATATTLLVLAVLSRLCDSVQLLHVSYAHLARVRQLP